METTFIYSLDSDTYLSDIKELITTILNKFEKICYITLDKSAESVLEFCKENDIDEKKIVIIDMISPMFKKCTNRKGVIYLDIKKSNMEKSIFEIIDKEKCDSIVFDSLSTMQIYFEEKLILRFVHELLVYSKLKHIVTNLIVQKKDVGQDWIKSIIPVAGAIKRVKF